VTYFNQNWVNTLQITSRSPSPLISGLNALIAIDSSLISTLMKGMQVCSSGIYLVTWIKVCV